jgi:hypothetical protein
MYLHEVMASVLAGCIAQTRIRPLEVIFCLRDGDWEIRKEIVEKFGLQNCAKIRMLVHKRSTGELELFMPSHTDMTRQDWYIKKGD